MSGAARRGPWVYDDFTPGQELLVEDFRFDAARVAAWDAIFAWPGGDRAHPSGPLLAMMMEAYLKAAQPRPPGNIHAGQKLTFTGRTPAPGAAVRARVECLTREIRRERRWVTFGVGLTSDGAPILAGEMRVIWAA